ncbi:MAG: AraC family transcriptional regulator [Castellaniella sp.]|uniref:AraC family transcriptional regulator n=1 Tax=Castellaniella sp. TaxID=1955812 RepID=UPI003A836744
MTGTTSLRGIGMHSQYSTREIAAQDKSRYWRAAVNDTYFDLKLTFEETRTFDATLDSWQIGRLSLSRLCSQALRYQRLDHHCTSDNDSFLITVPELSEIHFEQMGRGTWCPPGGFILEDSREPFLFQHPKTNTMWVLKVPGDLLRSRLRNPRTYCATLLDAREGAGSLFVSYMKLLIQHHQNLPTTTQALMGMHTVELLASTLENNPKVLHSENSAIRNAHLRQVEACIRAHLGNPALKPDLIAQSCNLSTRYLHMLCRETGCSVSEWIRELRLQEAFTQLQYRPSSTQIGTIAYQLGFTDQSKFCNQFKVRFGMTPSEARHSS